MCHFKPQTFIIGYKQNPTYGLKSQLKCFLIFKCLAQYIIKVWVWSDKFENMKFNFSLR